MWSDRRCFETVGPDVLGVGRSVQRRALAEAVARHHGTGPVLRLERSERLQCAGRGAAGGQVLPNGLNLLIRALRRADGGLLGLRREPEQRESEGRGRVFGKRLWWDATFYLFQGRDRLPE